VGKDKSVSAREMGAAPSPVSPDVSTLYGYYSVLADLGTEGANSALHALQSEPPIAESSLSRHWPVGCKTLSDALRHEGYDDLAVQTAEYMAQWNRRHHRMHATRHGVRRSRHISPKVAVDEGVSHAVASQDGESVADLETAPIKPKGTVPKGRSVTQSGFDDLECFAAMNARVLHRPGEHWAARRVQAVFRPIGWTSGELKLAECGRSALLKFDGEINGTMSGNLLLDSGASSLFCSQTTVAKCDLEVRAKEVPFRVLMPNGSTQRVCQEALVMLQIGTYRQKLLFDVVPDMPGYDLVLGLPWLQRHSAQVDFADSLVKLVANGVKHALYARKEDLPAPLSADMLCSMQEATEAVRQPEARVYLPLEG
jgi:Retroviral aspartyl protease